MKPEHTYKREGDTRDSILRSAEKLFAQNGFSRTTVRDIAKDSCVNVAMICYYFKTKEGLHKEIIENCFSILLSRLRDSIDPQKGPEERIYDIIVIYVTFLHHHKDLHRVILRETVSRSKHIEMIVEKYVSKNFELIHNVIEEGVKKGAFRKVDTFLSTFSLIGMILYYFTYEPIFTKIFPPDKGEAPITEYLPDHIFNIFIKGIKA